MVSRISQTARDLASRFRDVPAASGAVSSTEYKLLAFEDLDTNRIYDPSLMDLFPNRELVDVENIAENSTLQRRVLQQQGIRTVTSGICTANTLCVLKAISAEETRDQNLGR